MKSYHNPSFPFSILFLTISLFLAFFPLAAQANLGPFQGVSSHYLLEGDGHHKGVNFKVFAIVPNPFVDLSDESLKKLDGAINIFNGAMGLWNRQNPFLEVNIYDNEAQDVEKSAIRKVYNTFQKIYTIDEYPNFWEKFEHLKIHDKFLDRNSILVTIFETTVDDDLDLSKVIGNVRLAYEKDGKLPGESDWDMDFSELRENFPYCTKLESNNFYECDPFSPKASSLLTKLRRFLKADNSQKLNQETWNVEVFPQLAELKNFVREDGDQYKFVAPMLIRILGFIGAFYGRIDLSTLGEEVKRIFVLEKIVGISTAETIGKVYLEQGFKEQEQYRKKLVLKSNDQTNSDATEAKKESMEVSVFAQKHKYEYEENGELGLEFFEYYLNKGRNMKIFGPLTMIWEIPHVSHLYSTQLIEDKKLKGFLPPHIRNAEPSGQYIYKGKDVLLKNSSDGQYLTVQLAECNDYYVSPNISDGRRVFQLNWTPSFKRLEYLSKKEGDPAPNYLLYVSNEDEAFSPVVKYGFFAISGEVQPFAYTTDNISFINYLSLTRVAANHDIAPYNFHLHLIGTMGLMAYPHCALTKTGWELFTGRLTLDDLECLKLN